jgi:L,D-peptidoglycan transpeptidase YkuD (ErfK/YbiS/YcfS/YnhG family)
LRIANWQARKVTVTTMTTVKIERRTTTARLLLCILFLFSFSAFAAEQLIVSIAPEWNSTHGTLQRYEKNGDVWKAVGKPWPVLYGRNGLAWGRGLYGQDEKGLHKREKDGRAPAGIFKIGKVYTYDRVLPDGADFPFHTVTAADVWPDDVNHPDYNRHITVDPKNPPPWYAKQRMRLGDFAYRWMIEIRHNSDPPVPGNGSAIFFRIRRGPQKPSAGCTTMAEDDLLTLVRWLRAGAKPRYVLMPAAEYEARRKALGLP